MKESHLRLRGARRGQGMLVCLATFALSCTAAVSGSNPPEQQSGGGSSAGSGGSAGTAGSGGADPGWIPIHRLNNTEYNNAVADLLGTSLRPADYFQAQTASGFNTNAGTLANLDKSGAGAYFDAAKQVVDDVFAKPELKAKIVTCNATDAADTSCADSIIKALGRRVWRRPISPDELSALRARYTEARSSLGMAHDAAIGHILRILLTSAPFTYLVEKDPDVQAAAQTSRPLGGYELATRLSLALWSSVPDDALLDAAESGSLSDPAQLSNQVERMLSDPQKGPRFVESFMRQWLNITRLDGHAVDPKSYPDWNEDLRAAMRADASKFLGSFVFGGRPWSQFLTVPLDTTGAGLGGVFSADPPGARLGFLSLPAFLTAESVPTRTAPTFRGKVVLDAVLCTPINLPTFAVPDLEMAGGMAVDPANIRKKLEAHRASPSCAGCHALLDPIGLGIENFDAMGRYRTQYPNGDPIKADGEIEGTKFDGLAQLIPLLTKDPRLAACPSEKLLGFALRRSVRTNEDKPYIQDVANKWNSGTIAELVKQLVVSDAFRTRKVAASAL